MRQLGSIILLSLFVWHLYKFKHLIWNVISFIFTKGISINLEAGNDEITFEITIIKCRTNLYVNRIHEYRGRGVAQLILSHHPWPPKFQYRGHLETMCAIF